MVKERKLLALPSFKSWVTSPQSVMLVLQILSAQFTWHLHSTVMILAQLIMAFFMQQDGKASIHQPKDILYGGVQFTVTNAHSSYCTYNRKILFWMVTLSKAHHTNILPTSCKTPR
jgi:hypothetical protein